MKSRAGRPCHVLSASPYTSRDRSPLRRRCESATADVAISVCAAWPPNQVATSSALPLVGFSLLNVAFNRKPRMGRQNIAQGDAQRALGHPATKGRAPDGATETHMGNALMSRSPYGRFCRPFQGLANKDPHCTPGSAQRCFASPGATICRPLRGLCARMSWQLHKVRFRPDLDAIVETLRSMRLLAGSLLRGFA